jgi:GNAT superfamily N-acetyltransferase
MNQELTLRDATHADLEAIAGLFEAAGIDAPGTHDAATIASAWQRLHTAVPSVRVLLAVEAGVAVGTLTCFVLPQLGHGGAPAALVEGVAVHPQAQGHGVGRALMDEAMRIAREGGCYKLALSSNRKRTGAHAFYEHLGYAPHGVSFVVIPEGSSE